MIQNLLSYIAVIPTWVSATALLFLFGWLSYLHAKRDAKDRIYDWENMKNFEPVLGASPASFITTPLYRFFRLLGVDLLSTHGCFLMVATFLVYKTALNVAILEKATIIPACLIGVWFLACVNFAMPDYRGDAVKAAVNILNALADWIRGKVKDQSNTGA
jgi:hypothetical protein